MLIGDPERYTDAELDGLIRSLVDQAIPENRWLDYKAQPGRRRDEWAKDITSFANELGGVLVYGVPENSQGSERAPLPGRPYGMDPLPSLEQDLENVYSSAITPLLPVYRIRKVPVCEYPEKVCYVVWTPESWAGPHMVSAYADRRYYRRGEFRAIIMSERDVEERYRRRLELRGAADQFRVSEAAWHNSHAFPRGTRTTTLMVIPYLLIPNRIAFHEQSTRTWLQCQSTMGHWLPSMYGVLAKEGSEEDQHIIEMHRNGALVAQHSTEGTMDEQAQRFVISHQSEFHIWQRWLGLAAQLQQHIGYGGPIVIFAVLQISGMDEPVAFLLEDQGPFVMRQRGSSQARYTRPELRVEFMVESSGSELTLRPNKVLRDIADELCRAFGIWEADCFDEDDGLR